METKTAPIPSPFVNPHPKHLFCTNAAQMEAHRQLVQSEAWQRGVVAAQMQIVRDLCVGASTKLSEPQYLQASALAFSRIQGMNDFVNTFCNLAEIPPVPTAGKRSDNLEN